MSLILDALRKSEAERRRGQMPDLRAELPPTVRRIAPRRRWPLWCAGIAAAIAILALAWGVWDRAPKTPPAPASVEIANEAPAPAPSELPAEPAIVSTPPAPPIRSTPLPGAEPPPAQPVEDDVYAAASAREPVPTATPPASAQAPSATEPPAPAHPDPRYVGAIANNAASAPTVPTTPTPVAAPTPVAPLPMPPPATGAAVRIADLSPGEREQLPTLKISMHMFGPTPAQRFAIIDGTRVTQGDRVGEAVVEEIASDGVVLNWHGRRVSLPLR